MKHMRNAAAGRAEAGRAEVRYVAAAPVDGEGRAVSRLPAGEICRQRAGALVTVVLMSGSPCRSYGRGVYVEDPMSLAEGLDRLAAAMGGDTALARAALAELGERPEEIAGEMGLLDWGGDGRGPVGVDDCEESACPACDGHARRCPECLGAEIVDGEICDGTGACPSCAGESS